MLEAATVCVLWHIYQWVTKHLLEDRVREGLTRRLPGVALAAPLGSQQLEAAREAAPHLA